ncbi:hypothetical protein [Mangrovicoccus algicola]|uniref:Uncharacterized protein n=1 Tax=Mangrovicoccus algicola TaxID=2771008 RepID=A0A8J7CZH1_9RHOB|nr:hypothetical protein [Mangrovicoccus algicola]MBE3637873.1 hypothetical protein [Mangrovicoccus algicola]
MTLTPLWATGLLLVMVFCGRQFRENWKAQESGWVRRAWSWGLPAAAAFAVLAFAPFTGG